MAGAQAVSAGAAAWGLAGVPAGLEARLVRAPGAAGSMTTALAQPANRHRLSKRLRSTAILSLSQASSGCI